MDMIDAITAYNLARPLGVPAAVDYAEAEAAIVDYVCNRWSYRGLECIAIAIGTGKQCIQRGSGLDEALECAAGYMRRVH